MDLQLYRVDQDNYLVDFRNVGYYRTDPTQPGFNRVALDPNNLNANLADATNGMVASPTGHAGEILVFDSDGRGSQAGSRKGSEDATGSSESGHQKQHQVARQATPAKDKSAGENKIKEVCSPFLFFEVACRLIIELASG